MLHLVHMFFQSNLVVQNHPKLTPPVTNRVTNTLQFQEDPNKSHFQLMNAYCEMVEFFWRGTSSNIFTTTRHHKVIHMYLNINHQQFQRVSALV